MMGGEASLGSAIIVNGEVSSEGDFSIAGKVLGRVVCGGLLRLEEGGVLEAEVLARRAVLAGRVVGNVTVDEDVELLPSCRMIGDLRGARIVLHPGAAIRGLVEMGAFPDDAPAAAVPDVSAEALPAPAPDVSGEALPAPAPDVSAEALPAPAPGVSAEALPAPAPDVSAEALPAPAPDVSAEALPAPAPDVSAEALPAFAPDVSAETLPAFAPDVSAETLPAPAPDVSGEALPLSILPPPPMPASALSTGIRSQIVLKRGAPADR